MRWNTIGTLAAVAAIALATAACSNQAKYKPTGNGLIDMRNPDLLLRDRIAAAESAWAQVLDGSRDRGRTRQALKNLAWSRSTAPELRYTALDLLLSDPTPEGSADSAVLARLMLPTETSRQAVRIILTHTIRARWREGMLPAIVRSYAKRDAGVPDADRMEQKALESLVPGKQLEEIVFMVFLDPLAGNESRDEHAILRSAERTRDDAWELLSRLDPDGSKRARFLRSEVDAATLDQSTRLVIEDLRACYDDFGIIPDRGMELAWLRQLRRSNDPDWRARNQQWWSETAQAVKRLSYDQREGLELRHLEPVRWAADNEPAWINASRPELLSRLQQWLAGRNVYKRDPDAGESPRQERLSDWADTLSWGDTLTVLVCDAVIRDATVRSRIWTQAALDKKDEKTEYGGILDTDQDGNPRAVLFRPRQRDRVSDTRFVASEDMMRYSDRALAHYHMHVNERNNNDYAGPSLEDLEYARLSGRTSLVFTSLKEDTLNPDIYFPGGQVIDLGEYNRP